MNDYIPLAIVHSMRRCMHVRRDDRLDLTMLYKAINTENKCDSASVWERYLRTGYLPQRLARVSRLSCWLSLVSVFAAVGICIAIRLPLTRRVG
jgi:hypothetical protein